MLLSRIRAAEGRDRLVARDGTEAYVIRGADSIHTLAIECARRRGTLAACVAQLGFGAAVDLERACVERRVLAPIRHPDPRRLLVAGPGPGQGHAGDGTMLAAPGATIRLSAPANTLAPVPHVAAVCLIGENAGPWHVGFALAGLFVVGPDQVRPEPGPVVIGPEILVGELPDDIEGTWRVLRDGEEIRAMPFRCGGAGLEQALANFEQQAEAGPPRRHGDLHIRLLRISASAERMRLRDGDTCEIVAAPFGMPLRTMVAADPAPAADARIAGTRAT